MKEGKGNTLSVEFLDLMDEEHHLATLVANKWVAHLRHPAYIRMEEDRREVLKFRYATDTSSTSNSTNPHSHSTHRPKLAQIGDTLEAHYYDALFPHDHWNQFLPGTKDDNIEAKKRRIEEYMRNRHRLSGFYDTMMELVTDYVNGGDPVVEVLWTSNTASGMASGGRKGYVGPMVRRLDPRRVAYDFEANSFHESWKIVQSVKTAGDIAREIADERLSEGYREALRKSLQYRHYARAYVTDLGKDWLDEAIPGWGTQQSYFCESDNIEILTFYGDLYDVDRDDLQIARKIVVIDRKWVLLNEEVGTWDGKPLIYKSAWRNIPGTNGSMGPLHNLTGMQYMVNHLQNLKADAFDDSLRMDKVIRGVEDMKENPDGTRWWFVHDQGDVRNLSPDASVLNADAQIEGLERKMEEYAGVPPEAFGFKTPGEQTKFEVSERLTGASRMFQRKVSQFEQDIVEKVVNAELELAKTYLDENLELQVSHEEGSLFESITPETLKNKGTLVAVGAKHYATQQRLAQELAQFQQTIASDPEVLVHFPAKKLAQAWNSILGSFGQSDGIYEEFGRYTEQVEAQQRQQAAAAIVDDGAAVQQSLNDPEMLGLEDDLPLE